MKSTDTTDNKRHAAEPEQAGWFALLIDVYSRPADAQRYAPNYVYRLNISVIDLAYDRVMVHARRLGSTHYQRKEKIL